LAVPLKSSFNIDDEDLRHFAALRFERRNGISGISGHYKMPRGMSALEYKYHILGFAKVQDLQELPVKSNDHRLIPKKNVNSFVLGKVNKEFDLLKQLNPELGQIIPGGCDQALLPLMKWNIIMGCTSLYNFSDINCFIRKMIETSRRDVAGMYSRDPEYSKLKKELQKVSGDKINWVSSRQTLNKIKSQLVLKREIRVNNQGLVPAM
jgi:hypothetical protein